MPDRVWVLGAPDPEMAAIDAALRDAGEHVIYAMRVGARVRPSSAYGPGIEASCRSAVSYLVETDGPHLVGRAVRIDHHRPGDAGYGRPPAEYLSASSLGQVLDVLGRQPTPEERLVAAADHCLAAAYRGECPGVDPEALMQWRAQSRAMHQGRAVGAVLADIAKTQVALLSATGIATDPDCADCDGLGYDSYAPPGASLDSCSDPECCSPARIGVCRVCGLADMRRDPPWPELPEAAARLGIGYVSGPLIGPDGRAKYTCSGTVEQVRGFMDRWAPTQGLVGIYGDPARGFAGGYGCGGS